MELLAMFLPMIIAIIVIYFLMIRPQKKRQAEVTEMRDNLKIGDEILTVGGIKGTITRLDEEYIILDTADNEIEFTRSAIYRVINDQEPAQ